MNGSDAGAYQGCLAGVRRPTSLYAYSGRCVGSSELLVKFTFKWSKLAGAWFNRGGGTETHSA